MSELKEHTFCECDEMIYEYRGQLSNEMRPYYLKSEADKVIAEKDKEIAELKEQMLKYKQFIEEDDYVRKLYTLSKTDQMQQKSQVPQGS